ncbi:hypothetical protein [Streptomyces sp. NPDC088915]|uniref:hypothetical protein n=1 Tax=Streptomyces sp. NPDC088915 TaxID=3365912 RepID=UPI003813A9CB
MRRFLAHVRPFLPTLLLLPALLLATYTTGAALDHAAADATERAVVTAYNDGWIDGQADLTGDDNRDGRIDEDESGWDCRSMGNRQCGPLVDGLPAACHGTGPAAVLCSTVAGRPPYGWTNPDGSRTDNPDGRALVLELEELPGTPEWTAALRALDAECRAHVECR